MQPCTACGTLNGLDADDREAGKCHQCRTRVPFPDLDYNDIRVCYACLRSGKAAITKDTELGMISWEQAFQGVTHGIPGLNRTDFELVHKEDDWIGARLPQQMMFELLRTPTYKSIQGDRWQFCCREAMVFVGEWNREEFIRRAPDGDGRRFFEKIVKDPLSGLWEDQLGDVTGLYVFRCPLCGQVTAHWDLA